MKLKILFWSIMWLCLAGASLPMHTSAAAPAADFAGLTNLGQSPIVCESCSLNPGQIRDKSVSQQEGLFVTDRLYSRCDTALRGCGEIGILCPDTLPPPRRLDKYIEHYNLPARQGESQNRCQKVS